jgi:hypothetical protein
MKSDALRLSNNVIVIKGIRERKHTVQADFNFKPNENIITISLARAETLSSVAGWPSFRDNSVSHTRVLIW